MNGATQRKLNSSNQACLIIILYLQFMSQLVENISDTARWVAIYRALESERPDAVFHDPFARRLAGERGERIAATMEFANRNAWSFVARTMLFDRFIEDSIAGGAD